jgi:hypothetical protein
MWRPEPTKINGQIIKKKVATTQKNYEKIIK